MERPLSQAFPDPLYAGAGRYLMSFSPDMSVIQETLKNLSEGLLRSAGQTGAKGNLLEIHHPGAPLFGPVFLHTASEFRGLAIRLNQDESTLSEQRIRCDSGQLPFQDKVFQSVVLHHVVSDGSELELEEAVRVLARDGVLLVLGLNRMGWRYRFQERSGPLPGLSPLKVKARLESLQMTMQGFAGAGCSRLPMRTVERRPSKTICWRSTKRSNSARNAW